MALPTPLEQQYRDQYGNPDGEQLGALTAGGFGARDEQRRREQEALRSQRSQRVMQSSLRRAMRRGNYRAVRSIVEGAAAGGINLQGFEAGGGIASSERNLSSLRYNKDPNEKSVWSTLSGNSGSRSAEGVPRPMDGTPDSAQAPARSVVETQPLGVGKGNILDQAGSKLDLQREQVSQQNFVDSVRQRSLEIGLGREKPTEDQIQNMLKNAERIGLSSEEDKKKLLEIVQSSSNKGWAERNIAPEGIVIPEVVTNDPALDGTDAGNGKLYRYKPRKDMSEGISDKTKLMARLQTVDESRVSAEKEQEQRRRNLRRARIERDGGVRALLERGTDWSKVPRGDQVKMIMRDYGVSQKVASELLAGVEKRASEI